MAPGKGEQSIGQLRATLGGGARHLGQHETFGVVAHAFGKALGRPYDDRQKVVEVVSHAAGELADRFQLLCFA